MNQFITMYTETFNSLDTPQKMVFLFWSLCVVLFFSSFFMVIFMVIKDGIVNMFKTKPQPQRF